MLHLRDTSKPGEEVRTVPKRGPVTYSWHVTALCGKVIPNEIALTGDGILYNVCPDCLSAR